ncbi:MAG TPA: hypothetical protein DEB61_00825 [Alcanivorax sp.]|nr:hypothetical protein [Alcanivorax sp.]HAD46387.1 hypothetical protein [Alcanivorax sp.]HAI35581.1 hypothetical protein [Alcanivorax sp.]HAI90197.1 hypothetical protein [Alcanivorax sp.]HBP69200.1 hypothetical protein [Alcanivorax sp.]|tara:strand:+ start:1954 stop:4275 length:2322 start_codon:yes stop_codon:yes gene_type:complete
MIVEHPTLGELEFPDGTPPEAIKSAIRKAEQDMQGGGAPDSQPQAAAGGAQDQRPPTAATEQDQGLLGAAADTLRKYIPGIDMAMDVGSADSVGEGFRRFLENSPPATAIEALATLGGGLAGQVAGGYGGIYGAATDGAEKGAENVDRIAGAMSYEPRMNGAQAALRNMELAGRGWEALQGIMGTGGAELARAAGADPNSKAAAMAYAAGSTMPDAIASLVPATRAVRGSQAARGADAPPASAGIEDLAAGVEAASNDRILGGGARRRAARAVAEEVRPQPDLTRSFQELGVAPESVPPEVLSGNQAFRQLAGTARSVPASPLAIRYRQFLQDLSAKADDLSRQADAEDTAALNINVADDLQGDIARARQVEQDLYGRVDEAVAPATPVDVSPIADKLLTRLDEVGGDPRELSTFERRLMPRFLDRRTSETGQVEYTPKPKTWAALTGLRKELNAARGGKGGFGDAASYELDDYARTVSEAQRQAADQIGIGEDYAAAMEATGVKKAAQETAQKLLGKNLDKSFSAMFGTRMGNLSKGRVKEFEDAVNAIPESRRRQAVTSMVYDKIINRKNMDGRLDIAGFNRWYNELNSNPQAKRALFGQLDQQTRRDVDNLGKAVSAIKRANEDMVATGRLMAADQGFQLSESIVRKIAGALPIVGGIVGGRTGTAAGAASSAMSAGGRQAGRLNSAASELLAAPEFQRHVANIVSDAGRGLVRQSERALRDSIGWRRYYGALPKRDRDAITAAGLTGWLNDAGESAESGQASQEQAAGE